MKITAKLAYTQLKINKIRTKLTLIGIILSTALVTSIFSFGSSINMLIKGILGADYGEYGGDLSSLFVIPIIILSLIIVSMSVIVISNAFRVSAGERRSQFGILKSIGATKKQIESTVIYESIFLSFIGIPLGIILGLILAFLGIRVANIYIEEINSLVNIMMSEFTINLNFIVSWKAILSAMVVSFITILISAWIPARKASKTTAIDSIRKSEDIKIRKNNISVNPLIGRVFKFEGVLAAKNMKRNKRNLRASIISIVIGVVLFINISSLREQAKKMEKIMNPDIDQTVMVDYTSKVENVKNDLSNIEKGYVKKPIGNKEADEITKKLSEFNDTKIVGIGHDMQSYSAIIPSDMLSDEMKVAINLESNTDKELSVELLTLDPVTYEEILDKLNLEYGSNILINHYSYNDNGYEIEIEPFNYKNNNSIGIIDVNLEKVEIDLMGTIYKKDLGKEFFAPNSKVVRIIVPNLESTGYMWLSNPEDIKGFIDHANQVINESFPDIDGNEYMQLGYTARVYQIDDYMKIMNIAIVLTLIFVYSFVILLMLIGFTNIISTMSTNVYVRHKEFAVLQSVGMTFEGIERMINLESLMITLKSLAIGIPIGIVTSYLINKPIRAKFPIPYEFPITNILICIVVVFAVTFFIMHHSVKKIRKNNIIDTIRK